MSEKPKILVYGYGNPGRQDDGLGIELSEKIEEWARQEAKTNITVDGNYQLNIEDASTISEYDIVFFVDASKENIESFFIEEVTPSTKVDFTTHSASPAFVLELCHKIYRKYPNTYLLHIKGYEWEFMKEITGRASDNLEKAFHFLKNKIENIPEK
ncbi:MAG: hydrogenase maturation protease [Prolixibacteraceae bacterium]|nr:hydrogenase maturation protease [Prolixibacteraceae bacterium]